MPICNHSITTAVAGGSNIVNRTMPYDVDTVDALSITIPAGATNKEIDITFTYASINVLTIEATWPAAAIGVSSGNLTVKTNSSSMPDQTFTLKPNMPSEYHSDSAWSNPITANITKLYVSNAGTSDCVLNIALARDITP